MKTRCRASSTRATPQRPLVDLRRFVIPTVRGVGLLRDATKPHDHGILNRTNERCMPAHDVRARLKMMDECRVIYAQIAIPTFLVFIRQKAQEGRACASPPQPSDCSTCDGRVQAGVDTGIFPMIHRLGGISMNLSAEAPLPKLAMRGINWNPRHAIPAACRLWLILLNPPGRFCGRQHCQ